MQVGDHARIHTTGTSVFSIVEIDEASERPSSNPSQTHRESTPGRLT